MAKIGLYNLVKSTTLESNKSQSNSQGNPLPCPSLLRYTVHPSGLSWQERRMAQAPPLRRVRPQHCQGALPMVQGPLRCACAPPHRGALLRR